MEKASYIAVYSSMDEDMASPYVEVLGVASSRGEAEEIIEKRCAETVEEFAERGSRPDVRKCRGYRSISDGPRSATITVESWPLS